MTGRPRVPRFPAFTHWRTRWILGVLAAIGFLARAPFASRWRENFDGDEALVAVHATEILHGTFALYLPGQSYMGALQAAVAALFISVFGVHPAVVRLSPMLWILPGLAALLVLERRGGGRLATRGGALALAACWLFPPAVLFLAGVKARGGTLEALVLCLWTTAILWPGPSHGSLRQLIARWGATGVLYGLALWTSDQAFLFAPIVLGCWCFELVRSLRNARVRRAAARAGAAALVFLTGFAVAFVPAWLPRLAPGWIGPPGIDSTAFEPDLGLLLSSSFALDVWNFLEGALTTAAKPGGIVGIILTIYVAVTAGLLAIGIWRVLRRISSARSPAFLVTAWIAVASTAAFLVVPIYRADEQWFRYTFGVAPLLVVSTALFVCALPTRLAVVASIVLAALSTLASTHAHQGWETHRAVERAAFVEELRELGAVRVNADWQLAYFFRFLSHDDILAAAFSPPRFPEANAAVAFAPEIWDVISSPDPDAVPRRRAERRARAARQKSAPGPAAAPAPAPAPITPVEGTPAFFATKREGMVPPEARAVFDSLDLRSCLFPHYEPFPLLPTDSISRDWKGWPYRRPLDCFDSIIWLRDQSYLVPAPRLVVESAVDQLKRGPEFRVAAEWPKGLILRRRGPDRPSSD